MIKFRGGTPIYPPHAGFGEEELKQDTWYEDRDENGDSYGHRSEEDEASDLGKGDQYTRYPDHKYVDPYCRDTYKGRDTTQIPPSYSNISVYTFKLIVVDICSEEERPPTVAESGEESIDWLNDSFPDVKLKTRQGKR